MEWEENRTLTSVDLVIPSIGRPEQLARALAAAAERAPALNKTIVVHRAGDHATKSVAIAHGAFAVEVRRAGLAHAMRAGAEASIADVVAFSDDDAEVSAEWLPAIERAFDASIDIVAVGGRDAQPGGGDLSRTEQRDVGTIDRWGRVRGGHHRAEGMARDVAHLKGVNMSFRREAYLSVPAADLILGEGAQNRNELVVCLPLAAAGYRLRFVPAAWVAHYPAMRASGDERLASPNKSYETAFNESLAFWLARHPLRRRNLAMLILVGYQHAPGLLRLARGRGWRSVAATVRGVIRGACTGAGANVHVAVRKSSGNTV
ncbi:glycosyltransferase family 2 protein [Demequina sp. NBRC 110051]|uniref:glycosyltransferase family 2 protein n=1 Tax=Demequina sp. NBRC 110051 TaxID=1570340 RepID=UPI000A03799A|nr:glycosyltransferase family 2 protein [Demequina sp. NBRC 110051]